MKKVLCLVLAITLLLGASIASADRIQIDGVSDRGIQINRAGLNPSADEVIDRGMGYSPTTGRKLTEIEVPDGFVGAAVTGQYQPLMVQITNASNGVGTTKNGKMYSIAPVNGSYADVVYEIVQKSNGSQTRMTMVFSDTIPDYIGFVRSTRMTHVYLRQEWDAAFCTSGYALEDVPEGWKKMGVKNPASGSRTEEDPGIIYVADYSKPWSKYTYRLSGIDDSNNVVFMAADLVQNIVPKDHVPANHTWLFSDELPEGGDSGRIVYVTYGNVNESDNRLEYDENTNAYIRYVTVGKNPDVPYMDSKLINPRIQKVRNSEGETVRKIVADDRVTNNVFTFNNVIIQGIHMHWLGGERPDPDELVGTGNADYFMGGKHYAGVWERTDWNSRTVFYGADGNEIKLQRGRTLIIMMPYLESFNNNRKNPQPTKKFRVEYE